MICKAIQCPNCKDVIFSRARHDFRSCSCGSVAIDGGFDYTRIVPLKRPEVSISKTIAIDVSATRQDLYKDWNEGIDKFGKYSVEEFEALKSE